MESKIDNIIFKYLDMKYGALEQRMQSYGGIIFAFPGEEWGKLGWGKSGDLFVLPELSNEISYYFGMDEIDSIRVIGNWFEDRYNLKVINTFKSASYKLIIF
jgi:hypothetical protein